MLSSRKVRTASGSVAVQVVQYQRHKSIIVKHIGSGKEADEVSSLVKKANEWIGNQTGQASPHWRKRPLVPSRSCNLPSAVSTIQK